MGSEFYVDVDNDLYSNIEVISVSDDINLGYVHNNIEDRSFNLLSGGDVIFLDHTDDMSSFMFNDSIVNLFVRPNTDINGAEFIEFRVGDSVDFSEQIYTSTIFFSPVADAPLVKIRDSQNEDDVNSKNLKFIGDESPVYFELASNGQNSEIISAELSIQQGNMVLHRTEFDEGSLVTDYTVDLVGIVNTFSEIGGSIGEQAKYIPTNALEAQFRIEVQDKVEGIDGSDIVDTDSFQLIEEITVIPDSSRIKSDVGYRETLGGFSNFDEPSSDFSEFGESDDITYIDPDFGVGSILR